MGKSNSKSEIRESLEIKDWKYIEKLDPEKIKHLDKWIKDYGFRGQLRSQKIPELQKAIKNKTRQNEKKMNKEGFEDTKFWLEVAKRREEGEKRGKQKQKEKGKKDEKSSMYCRSEDNETGPVGRSPQTGVAPAPEQASVVPAAEQASVAQASAAPVPEQSPVAQLYPDLSGVASSPPPYNPDEQGAGALPSNTLNTRSKGSVGNWSNVLGKVLSPKPPKAIGIGDAETYPMIQVANPNVAPNQPPTILVYRTWTMEDVKKAVAGIASHKEDVEQFIEDMENARKSYHLNGQETQQIWMTALGSDWYAVRGDWNPIGAGGTVLSQDNQELSNRVRDLGDRVKTKYKKRANYTEIGRVKQKDDETFEDYRIRLTTAFKTHSGLVDNGEATGPYQQQLKNALHAGSKDAIRGWVTKHYIGLSTGSLEEYVNHALHAEKVTKDKKGKKTSADTFYQDDEQEVYFQDRPGRGGFRGRGFRGRGGFRDRGRGRGRNWDNRYQGRECWACGKEGHSARYCTQQSA